MNKQEEEILKLLEQDLKAVGKALDETSKDIKNQEFSKYPIILSHLEELSIADKIIDRLEYQTHFSHSASTLEVLVAKGVILKEREEALISQFKSKSDQLCILLIHPQLMKIIFSPQQAK